MKTRFLSPLPGPFNRRHLLALGLAPLPFLAAQQRPIPASKQTYVDPVTEFNVTRWTEESVNAQLPGQSANGISRNDKQILYASDRSGSWQPYLLQIPGGDSTQLLEIPDLLPSSLRWIVADKELACLTTEGLSLTTIAKKKPRMAYRCPSGWQPDGQFVISDDGRLALLGETRNTECRIMQVDLRSGKSRALASAKGGALRAISLHPRYGAILQPADGPVKVLGGSTPLKAPQFVAGQVLDARFDERGGFLLYLVRTTTPQPRMQLQALDLKTGKSELLANTSQFSGFSMNKNGSVFVGASASKAQPFLLLLLRVTRREFALMEHRAKDPQRVRPFFSNDSETVYFQSDRLGKSCIFSVSVKGLIEKT